MKPSVSYIVDFYTFLYTQAIAGLSQSTVPGYYTCAWLATETYMYDAILKVIYEIQFLWLAGVRESAKKMRKLQSLTTPLVRQTMTLI